MSEKIASATGLLFHSCLVGIIYGGTWAVLLREGV